MSDDSSGNQIVRRAASSDAVQISVCLLELGYGTPPELVSQKLALLAGSEYDVVFVADNSLRPGLIGVVSAHVFPLFHAPGQITRVTSLAVRGEARGKGVGRNLMAAVETWSWNVGARRIEVTSGDHRPDAHAFYQAIGYSLDERRFIKHAPAKVG